MARRKLTSASLSLSMSVAGIIPDLDDRKVQAAIRRAQRKNARRAEQYVKALADIEVKGYGGRGTRDYPGSMRDYYEASVDANGDVVLENPTQRAHFFEEGTPPHEIWASGLFERGRATPARGSRGTFTRGARALAFDFVDGGRFIGEMVEHPGQEANPIAWRTMEENLDYFAENVADELERALSVG